VATGAAHAQDARTPHAAAALVFAALACIAGSAGAQPFVYVSGAGGVVVIDAAEAAAVDTFAVGATTALAITPDGRSLYAGRTRGDDGFEVVALDARTGELAASLAVAGAVLHLALSPGERRLWVSHARYCTDIGSCTGSSGITVLDLDSRSVVATFADLRGSVALDPSGARAYCIGNQSIVAVDVPSFVVAAERPSICCIGSALTLHPNGHTVYALGNEFGGFIAIADLRREIDWAPPSFVRGQSMTELDFQTDIAFHPSGGHAYLPGSIGPRDTLFVMDTSDAWAPRLERVIELEQIGGFATRPWRIALAPDGARAYLLSADDSVTVMDLASGAVAATIAVPAGASDIVVDPSTRSTFSITGCVVHFSGCGGSREFGVVHLEPLGRIAAVDMGFFAFEDVPPGEYTLTYEPACNPAGCTGPVRVRIVDRDGSAAFYRSGCAADCSVDRRVTVDEVIVCVSMALGGRAGCALCDLDRDTQVTIDELERAVGALLNGCAS
jgi:DNA-binding beta-propeller fold protein YncE